MSDKEKLEQLLARQQEIEEIMGDSFCGTNDEDPFDTLTRVEQEYISNGDQIDLLNWKLGKPIQTHPTRFGG